jgi:diguanylate cyclase (GGDEF)-like protein
MSIFRRILIAYIVSVSLLALNGAVFVMTARQIVTYLNEQEHVRKLNLHLPGIFSSLLESESAAKSIVLNGREKDAQHYEAAYRELQQRIDEALETINPESYAAENIKKIQTQAKGQHALVEQIIRAVQASRQDDIRLLSAAAFDEPLVEEAKRVTKDLLNYAQIYGSDANAKSKENLFNAQASLFGFLLLVVLCLATSFWIIVRALRQNASLTGKLRDLANLDELTGLPNRRSLLQWLDMEVERANHGGYRFGLMFIDLDGFKSINDKLGHQCGDIALVEAAEVIKRTTRSTDFAARLGGDEFVIAISNLSDEKELARIALRVIDQVKRIERPEMQQMRLGASIGLAVYPDHGKKVEALINAADEAMYCAKKRGKGTFVFADNAVSMA